MRIFLTLTTFTMFVGCGSQPEVKLDPEQARIAALPTTTDKSYKSDPVYLAVEGWVDSHFNEAVPDVLQWWPPKSLPDAEEKIAADAKERLEVLSTQPPEQVREELRDHEVLLALLSGPAPHHFCRLRYRLLIKGAPVLRDDLFVVHEHVVRLVNKWDDLLRDEFPQ